MQVLQADIRRIKLALSREELRLASNVLNEVCNGLRMDGFVARVGLTEKDAGELLARLDVTTRGAGPEMRTVAVDFARAELVAIRNALRETLRELSADEFGTRVGLPFAEGQAYLRDLDRLVGGWPALEAN